MGIFILAVGCSTPRSYSKIDNDITGRDVAFLDYVLRRAAEREGLVCDYLGLDLPWQKSQGIKNYSTSNQWTISLPHDDSSSARTKQSRHASLYEVLHTWCVITAVPTDSKDANYIVRYGDLHIGLQVVTGDGRNPELIILPNGHSLAKIFNALAPEPLSDEYDYYKFYHNDPLMK